MGIVSSICKRKPQVYHDPPVQNNYTQTTISTAAHHSPSTSSEKTHCSAISREPTHHSSFRNPYYFSPSPIPTYSKPIRGHPDFPLFSTPFYIPKDPLSYHHTSNPYLAQAYSHPPASASPSFSNRDYPRTTRVSTVSDFVQTTDMDTQIRADIQQQSSKPNSDEGVRLIKRSASAPIDMFLIDISNEHVLLGQPVSMNIRHLLLDTIENHHTHSSTPIRIEPATVTTYAHENLLSYIPYVCERYPNITVDSDQLTRNTLHIRVPSLDTLT